LELGTSRETISAAYLVCTAGAALFTCAQPLLLPSLYEGLARWLKSRSTLRNTKGAHPNSHLHLICVHRAVIGTQEAAQNRLKNPAKDFSSRAGYCTFVCVMSVCLLYSVKWLVGPGSTSNRATSFRISIGDIGRYYGISLCRTDSSDQRRARCWLPFFRKAGRKLSFYE
jgi:hypothetical protein